MVKELERRRQKNKKKRDSKKANKKNRTEADSAAEEVEDEVVELGENEAEGVEEDVKPVELKAEPVEGSRGQKPLEVEIEYVGETPKLDEKDPNFHYFSRIFENFKVERVDWADSLLHLREFR